MIRTITRPSTARCTLTMYISFLLGEPKYGSCSRLGEVMEISHDSAREFYEKGKYIWDEAKRTVVLTAKKDLSIRQYRIEDEGTLVQLNSDGTKMPDADDYTLRRSDTVKSREVHIH
ncbi:copper resistance protein NlpE N-terminal domain-containing protein [Methylovulum miyakonense]|uniref:copper resistance protein NlpE N-terminal domain-containing protein n=1 Tax=Methylovulum miyakonense TaxID=645578 RepID=UPI003BB5EC28